MSLDPGASPGAGADLGVEGVCRGIGGTGQGADPEGGQDPGPGQGPDQDQGVDQGEGGTGQEADLQEGADPPWKKTGFMLEVNILKSNNILLFNYSMLTHNLIFY